MEVLIDICICMVIYLNLWIIFVIIFFIDKINMILNEGFKLDNLFKEI